jgi:hypothetical protein
MGPSACARIASALFAAEALFAVIHRAVGGQYHGFTFTFSAVIDWLLLVVWITAAAAGVVQQSGRAFTAMWIGAFASLMHGLNISVSTSGHRPFGVGIPFAIAAIAQAWLIIRAVPAFREVTAEPREAAPAGPVFARHARTVA